MKYPTTKKGLKEYFKTLLAKSNKKSVHLYHCALAASGSFASDAEYDDLDDALEQACKGLMNFCNSEAADELFCGEYYAMILECLYDVSRRAKVTLSF